MVDSLDEWIPRLEPLTIDELVKRIGELAADRRGGSTATVIAQRPLPCSIVCCC
jgi:hypothetical protein